VENIVQVLLYIKIFGNILLYKFEIIIFCKMGNVIYGPSDEVIQGYYLTAFFQ